MAQNTRKFYNTVTKDSERNELSETNNQLFEDCIFATALTTLYDEDNINYCLLIPIILNDGPEVRRAVTGQAMNRLAANGLGHDFLGPCRDYCHAFSFIRIQVRYR